MLFGLAAVWPSLGSGWAVRIARYRALVGFYANWVGAWLAALWSAKGMFIVSGVSMPAGQPTPDSVTPVATTLTAV
jgi:hypothetical protein